MLSREAVEGWRAAFCQGPAGQAGCSTLLGPWLALGCQVPGAQSGLSMPCASTHLSLEPPLWDQSRMAATQAPRESSRGGRSPWVGGTQGPELWAIPRAGAPRAYAAELGSWYGSVVAWCPVDS